VESLQPKTTSHIPGVSEHATAYVTVAKNQEQSVYASLLSFIRMNMKHFMTPFFEKKHPCHIRLQ
jgi:hypothetical protein